MTNNLIDTPKKKEQQSYANEMAIHWNMTHCEYVDDRIFSNEEKALFIIIIHIHNWIDFYFLYL